MSRLLVISRLTRTEVGEDVRAGARRLGTSQVSGKADVSEIVRAVVREMREVGTRGK